MLVGEDPASAIYVRRKREACEEVGIRSFHHEPAATIAQEELLALVDELNADDEVDGILVQLPLPEGLDADAVVEPSVARQGRRRADARQRRAAGPRRAGPRALHPAAG